MSLILKFLNSRNEKYRSLSLCLPSLLFITLFLNESNFQPKIWNEEQIWEWDKELILLTSVSVCASGWLPDLVWLYLSPKGWSLTQFWMLALYVFTCSLSV